MSKQLSLLKAPRKNTKRWWIEKQTTYGGSLNYRKLPRPFDSKKLTHAVFKAKLGRSTWFIHLQGKIEMLLRRTAERYDVKIKRIAVNKDHIHVLFHTKKRQSQVCFLRLFAAEMGRRYKVVKRHFGITSREFWVARPFTRLVSRGRRSLRGIQCYIQRNRDEAMGFVAYQPRAHKLTALLERWQRATQVAFNSSG